MAPEYRIDVRDTAGTLQAVLTDYRWLAYRIERNAPGVVRFAVRGTHPLLSTIADKWQVEVWRRDADAGIPWTCDLTTLFRDDVAEDDDDGDSVATLTCPGVLSMLGWRINAYPAGTANRTTWSGLRAETIMKSLVTNNGTASATTANGRDRAGQISGLTVQADAAGGNLLTWERARANLLAELQDLARVGGLDFDLVRTGPAAWEFRTYVGQRGTDRSATVLFATDRGNMRRPRLTRVRSSERTVAIVAGQGEGSARRVRVRTGAGFSASNNIEVLVDARSGTTDAALDAAGDERLDALRSRADLQFDVIQTPACRYGQHYGLGDRVTGRYRGVQAVKLIDSIAVEYRDGREVLGVETSDP